MKRLISFIVLMVAAPAAHAEVFTKVCLADGNTPLALADPCIPLVYRPIMVGTRLTIIIGSDADGYWDGGELSIWDANRNYGVLSGGSLFPAAGDTAIVWPFQTPEEVNGQWHDANGFGFSGSDNAIAGNWFIIDYNAVNVGFCSVNFYDRSVNWDNPLYEISFTHVRTRDFNNDGIVNFEDFAVLGLNWRRTDCLVPADCAVTDLDEDGDIDFLDLKLFADFWLERTR